MSHSDSTPQEGISPHRDGNIPRSLRAQYQTEATEGQVLRAIFDLKSPMPHQIKKYLDARGRKIALRTIHRVLRRLSNKGTVVHLDGKYSISRVDLRYVGELFGSLALDCIFNNFQDTIPGLPINESLHKLVTGFGVLAFYMCIEASKPIEDDSLNKKERYKLINSWLNHTFPVEHIFNNFLAAYGWTGPKPSHESNGMGKDTMSIVAQTLVEEFPNELGKDTISTLTRTLQELYPYEYNQIQHALKMLSSSISGNLRELKKGLPLFILRDEDLSLRDAEDKV